MNKPHKHVEIIKQWAEGAEIQYYSDYTGAWEAVDRPCFFEADVYRVKPQLVEYWVTYYPEPPSSMVLGGVYTTKEEAEKAAVCRRGVVVHTKEVIVE
jgi:hypothetical protein|tara:strand:+ start:93 stop:386 length:294 start_codon:yes stop_codon:yes gene_type:complete